MAKMNHKSSHTESLLERLDGVEKQFLFGRRDRSDDLQSAIRIFLEVLRGYEALAFEPPCITVFGSARFGEDHPYYQKARAAFCAGSAYRRADYCCRI